MLRLSRLLVAIVVILCTGPYIVVRAEDLRSVDISEDRSSFVAQREQVLICNDDDSILNEHTYLDVIDHIIPDELILKEALAKHAHLTILSRKVKLKSIVGYGEFLISYGNTLQNYSFNDIYLLQEKGLWARYVCGSSLIGSNGWLSPLCQCGSTSQSSPRDGLLDALIATQYCVSQSVCTDKSIAVGSCRIRVDPFVNSCVVIGTRSLKDEDVVRSSVTYKYHIPTLADFLAPFQHDYVMLAPVLPLLSLVPTSLFSLTIGWLVVSNAREMAETWYVQLLVEVLTGIGLALVLIVYLCYWLYRTTMRSTIGRIILPFADLAPLPLSASLFYLVAANPKKLAAAATLLLDFWSTGSPFGVWWLGKAYFVSCVSAVLSVGRYLQLFQPDSFSLTVLHYFLKTVGLVLLSSCCGSPVLRAVLVSIGCFEEHLRHLLWVAYVTGTGLSKKPTYKFLSPKKLSLSEVEEISRRRTQLELQKLQKHFLDNAVDFHRVTDILRETDRKEELHLLRRFTDGSYSGVPSQPPEDPTEQGWGWLIGEGRGPLLAVSIAGLALSVLVFSSHATAS